MGYTASEKQYYDNCGYHNWKEMVEYLDNVLYEVFGFIPKYALTKSEWKQHRYKTIRDDYILTFDCLSGFKYSTRELWQLKKYNLEHEAFIDITKDEMKLLKDNEKLIG